MRGTGPAETRVGPRQGGERVAHSDDLRVVTVTATHWPNLHPTSSGTKHDRASLARASAG